MKRITKITLFALGLVAMPTIALPFTFTTIDPPGSTFTFPFGINPQGDIVGHYVASGDTHGFLLHDGAFTTIDFLGATSTFARRINPQGDIVGFYAAGGITHGFLLHEGFFTTIDFRALRPPLLSVSILRAISSAGTLPSVAATMASCFTKAPSPASISQAPQ